MGQTDYRGLHPSAADTPLVAATNAHTVRSYRSTINDLRLPAGCDRHGVQLLYSDGLPEELLKWSWASPLATCDASSVADRLSRRTAPDRRGVTAAER